MAVQLAGAVAAMLAEAARFNVERGAQIIDINMGCPAKNRNSTAWLTDIVWTAARRLGHAPHFLDEPFPVEVDHMHFVKAGIPSVDLIDLDYADWHTAGDTLDKVSARSLQVVGDVVLAALPDIEARLLQGR